MATYLGLRWHIPPVTGRYVAYYRDSSSPKSGLSSDAQQSTTSRFLDNGKSRLVSEFVENEVKGSCDRPALRAAIRECRAIGAKLLLGKVGRLRRDVGFLTVLQESGVKFIAVDLPELNHLTVHLMIYAEMDRRQAISSKVREALAIARDQGVRLGGDRGNRQILSLGPAASVTSRRARALSHARLVMRHIKSMEGLAALSLRKIAMNLDRLGVTAPRGGKWTAAQVRMVVKRCENDH